MSSKKLRYLPLFFALTAAVGFLLGSGLGSTATSGGNLSLKPSSAHQLDEVLNYIDKEYVDTIDKQNLIDKTVSFMLQELDPHSYYISREELQAMNEPLEGNFDGIGVQFNINKDTIYVITPVAGGPSEKVGILAGDRIIKVEGETVAGVGISNSKVLKLLKGPKGTKVNVTILRNQKELDFTITRGSIPIYSVDASYMLSDDIGYIKIARFARTTYDEFISASEELKNLGATKLVIDLRGNGGGYLDAAVDIADEFLRKDQMIVYTEGKARPKEEYFATSRNSLSEMSTAILIDGASASASEILAGALQDNDQGTIVGRRSFGKGLVQEQTPWPDGSATRLTIARYYTPTGRCIQKPYAEGNDQYFEEQYHRYETGELYSKDSTLFSDSLKFTTPGGKTVYGGGGIFPDVFVPLDTTSRSVYFNQLSFRGIIYQFAFDYADKNRERLQNEYTASEFTATSMLSDSARAELIKMAEDEGVEFNAADYTKSKKQIEKRVKAYIARNVWDDKAFYSLWNSGDAAIQAAENELQ